MKYNSGKRRSRLFRQKRSAPILPIGLIVVLALLVGFFWLIPTDFLRNTLPVNVAIPTFTPIPILPTITRTPRPVNVHGGTLVFTCTRGSTNHLCTINADGSGFQQITNSERNDYYPTFDPLSSDVIFAASYQGGFDLFAIDLKMGHVAQLTYNVGNVFSPSFSPDGQQIVFVNRVGGGPYSLWLSGRNGEFPHSIYTGTNTIVAAAWSPSGDRIAFAMAVDQQNSYELFLLDVNNLKQPPQRITIGLPGIDGSLVWSPDAKNILFCAGPDKLKNIFRADINNETPIQLTSGGFNNAAAAYSPDGQFIVFNSLRNNTNANLYIMRSDGSGEHQLTTDTEPDWQPQWGP
jgi:Tol biopolymer transport system component